MPLLNKKMKISMLRPGVQVGEFLVRHLERIHTKFEKLKRILEFKPRADDIYVVTYPESGTIRVQAILYQLTTDGDMNIRHINDVVPHLEAIAQLGWNTVDGFPSPRVFKTHLPYRSLSKYPGRFIYIMRNGANVVRSYYNQNKALFGFKGSFDDFFELFMQGKAGNGSWFIHVRDYLSRRQDKRILFLRYEDLIEDPEGTVKKIVDFCELPIGEEDLARVLERSSLAFMEEHQEKFEPIYDLVFQRGIDLNQFIRKGKTSEGRKKLSEDQKMRYRKRCEENLAGLGLEDYFGKEPGA